MSRSGIKALAVIVVVTLISIQGVVEAPLGRISGDLLSSLSSLWKGPEPDPWIGRIKTVSGTAAIIRGNEHLPATLGATLYQADAIETGADGSIGITFIDDSVFSTGPDSRLALAEFHFDSNSSKGNMLAELKKGTLAVVSGEITHATPGAMSIKTPTSILGVRGTTFAVEIVGAGAAAAADHAAEPARCEPIGDGGSARDACTAATPHPEERYVVLPNADGRPGSGAITVHRGNTDTTLDQPYAAAQLQDGEASATTMDAAETQAVFQQALAARPLLPAHFRVHFLLDSDQMTPESAAIYSAAVTDIKKRQTYDIELIGYTDTLANEAHNRRLSVRRAEAVRRGLVKDGVDPKAIAAEGRGEGEQLVRTAAGVAEPRNRRVEIIIR